MHQIIRYGVVGVVSNAVAYACYLILTETALGPRAAMTVVYVIAALAGYWGNRSLTFGDQSGLLGSAGRYVVAHGVGYATNLAILTVFVEHLGYSHRVVQATAVLVVAGLLFLLFRGWVFTTPTKEAGPGEPRTSPGRGP